VIVNGQALLIAKPIFGMFSDKRRFQGFSHGLTECGYDIRLAKDVWMFYGRRFVLANAMEYFHMPNDLMGRVLNKSTWARMGVDASMTTNIEPGWRGFLTLELRYAKMKPILLRRGTGIAQVIFERIQETAEYAGRYQDQPNHPVDAILSDDLPQT